MDIVTRLADFLVEEHPVHAAASLTGQPVDAAAGLLNELESASASRLLQNMPAMTAVDHLRAMHDISRAPVIETMAPDDAARILRSADRRTADILLAGVKPAHARAIRNRMRFADHTIGAHVETAPTLPPDATVGDARGHANRSSYPYLYVVDRAGKLVGVVKFASLELERADTVLASVMTPDVVCLSHQTPVHVALRHPAWADHDVLPVVDAPRTFVGGVRHRVLRQRTDRATDRSTLDTAVSTLLNLGQLYWTTSAALFLGQTIRGGTLRKPRG